MLTANNGVFTTSFTSTMLGLTRQTGNGVTVSFVRTADGQLIAATTGSSAYYLTDNVGSTVGIVNSGGVKTAAYAYDPYGRTRTATGGAAANASATPAAHSTPPPAQPNSAPATTTPAPDDSPNPTHQDKENNSYLYAGANPTTNNDPAGLGLGDFFEWVGIGMVCASAHVGDTFAAPETPGTAFLVADLACTGSLTWGLSSHV